VKNLSSRSEFGASCAAPRLVKNSAGGPRFVAFCRWRAGEGGWAGGGQAEGGRDPVEGGRPDQWGSDRQLGLVWWMALTTQPVLVGYGVKRMIGLPWPIDWLYLNPTLLTLIRSV
jgi:hypothetical protein